MFVQNRMQGFCVRVQREWSSWSQWVLAGQSRGPHKLVPALQTKAPSRFTLTDRLSAKPQRTQDM